MSLVPEQLVKQATMELKRQDLLTPRSERVISDLERTGYLFTKGLREGWAEGRKQGQEEVRAQLREALLHQLNHRSLVPSPALMERISVCENIPQLARLYATSHTLSSLEELSRLLDGT